MAWPLQEAKQQFSEVVRRALAEGPQLVTRHGREAVVVVGVEEFRKGRAGQGDFKRFLRSGPPLEALELTRDRRRARRVKL